MLGRQPGFGATILIAALLIGAAASEAQLARTHPRHYGSGLGGTGDLNARGLPDFRTPDPRSRVIMRRRRGLQDSGRPNQKLTRACRTGELRQAVDHRFVAVLGEKVYGAAIGNHGSLRDPKKLTQPGIVYVFVGQGTTNCRVYSMGAFQP